MSAADSNNIPEIIQQAAKSTLGLFALGMIAVSIIGFFFFHKEGWRIRFLIFILLFGGLIAFGAAFVHEQNPVGEIDSKHNLIESKTSPETEQSVFTYY